MLDLGRLRITGLRAAVLLLSSVLFLLGPPLRAQLGLVPEDWVGAVWVAEPESLTKVAASDGAILLRTPAVKDARGLALDEARGIVWTYSPGALSGHTFAGSPQFTSPVAAATERCQDANTVLDLLTGPAASNASRTSLEESPVSAVVSLAEQMTDGTAFVDLTADYIDGSAWLGVCTSLFHFDSSGTLLWSRDLLEPVQAIAADPLRGRAWVGTLRSLRVFDRSGEESGAIALEALDLVLDIDVEQPSGSVWVALPDRIRLYDDAATLLVDEALPGIVRVAADPVAGAWAATAETLVRLDPSGQRLFETAPFGDSARLLSLAADLRDGSAWAASADHLAHVGADGQVSMTVERGEGAPIRTIATYSDRFPPEIVFVAPPEGAFLNVKKPTLGVEYGDSASGTDPATLSMTLDGQTLPVSCSATGSSAACVPSEDLPEGKALLSATVADLAGNLSAPALRSITIDTVPPEPARLDDVEIIDNGDGTFTVQGAAGSVEGGAAVSVRNLTTGEEVTVLANDDGSFTLILSAQAGDELSIVVTDAAGNSSSPANVYALPPDPSQVAPALDPSVPTDFSSATAFLHTGPNSVQKGVAPGTIEAKRVAVLRGTVRGRDGTPLPGVEITVLGHPEYGYTHTRSDGMFDIAVNGGGFLTLRYEKDGFPPVQRQDETPWRDYSFLPDVVMVPYDARVTTIDLTSGDPMQVARGNPVSDDDGTRQATILFPQGTQAEMVMADGSTQPLDTLSVRATEYTVGDSGPQAMPAELPPTSAYTYAVELSVDEAVAAGATEVRFSEPVINYTENFLDFPVGGIVPVGYYDRRKGQWIPSDNGRVIKILGITSGRADVDTDGDGADDDATELASLGISDTERERLASMYPPGQSLWRVPVTHFTPWDHNWPYGFPGDATPPDQGPPTGSSGDCGGACCGSGSGGPSGSGGGQLGSDVGGSIIECRNQVLGEEIPIVGTPFSLHYQSHRVPAASFLRSLTIPLSGETIPASLGRIDLEVHVAGRRFATSHSPAANLTVDFDWDGEDAYGRMLQGSVPTTVRVGYVYPAIRYTTPASFARSFAVRSSTTAVVANRPRGELTVWQEGIATTLGPWDARGQGMGGWTLSAHHTYDRERGAVYFGDGNQQAPGGINVITTAAGVGSAGFSGDGGPATSAELHYPWGTTVAPDGTLYITESGGSRIRRVGPDGTITTVAGNNGPGFSGDGGPATSARLYLPYGVALTPDGSLYIADTANHRIRRVAPNGIITTVAGVGTSGFNGDGIPATSARLNYPYGVAAGPDGSLYIADTRNHRIRQVAPDGIITTLAGTGAAGFSGNGGPAASARLNDPHGVAVAPDGRVYIADTRNHRIRRVAPDGIITTLAGTGTAGFSGDGGPATSARLSNPDTVTVAPDGNLYLASSSFGGRIRQVTPDGIITTVAGVGTPGFGGDGGPATRARFDHPFGVAVGPDGSLYIADSYNQRVRRIGRPGFGQVVPAPDQSVAYEFDWTGRHLRTRHALTGAALLQFAYDGGRLARIEDGDGNVTAIEHDGTGQPTALVAPFGQRTTLSVDVTGYLTAITNPAGETTRFTYAEGGLMTGMTTPRGHAYRFAYDDQGRLVRDDDPAGGSQELARTELGKSYEVARTTALGRTTRYRVERLSTGDESFTNVFPDGTSATNIEKTDGTSTATLLDKTFSEAVKGPDPRFGMMAPVASRLILTTPAGLSSTATVSRSVTLTDPGDPLSLESLTDTVTLNDQVFRSVYDASSKTFTETSPGGRRWTAVIDSQGRIVKGQLEGLHPTALSYDSNGHLETLRLGTGAEERTTTFSYDSDGYLNTVTDPLGRQVTLERDSGGRIIRETLPEGESIVYTYDSSGNITSITPPGKPGHSFSYTPIDRLETYSPPPVGSQGNETAWVLDADRDLTRVRRPDGQTLDFTYDAAGRLVEQIFAQGRVVFSYDSTTGQLTNITAPGGSTLAFSYDGALLTGSTSGGNVSGSVTRAYDSYFRLASERVNGGNEVTFQYDSDSLLTEAGALTLSRSAVNGLLTGTSLAIVTDHYAYNGFGELTTYGAAVNGTGVYSVDLFYDVLGRIVTRDETVAGVSDRYAYEYDLAGRLAQVTRNGVTQSTYVYDQNGNRLSRETSSGRTEGTYDDQDRLVRYGGASYRYTANGEILARTESGQVTGYEYDAFGSLRFVSLPGGTGIDYVIDGLHRRVGKKVDGVLERAYLYRDRLNPVAELDSSGSVVSRFVYGTRPNVPDYLVRGGTIYRIISDPLGSPKLVIDSSTGAIAQRMDYDEFGNVTNDTNPGFQPFGFAGGLYDRDTGLVRFGWRDYDPVTGRWTTKDPLGFSGGDTNLYSYVWNNPTTFVDPLGLESDEPEAEHPDQLPLLPDTDPPPKPKNTSAWERFKDFCRAVFCSLDVSGGVGCAVATANEETLQQSAEAINGLATSKKCEGVASKKRCDAINEALEGEKN